MIVDGKPVDGSPITRQKATSYAPKQATREQINLADSSFENYVSVMGRQLVGIQ